jgi:ABC-type molybdate transport system substrate-binding protein
MVCPHDTAGDPIKWFQFAQYLTRYCESSTKYYKCLDFTEFHQKMSQADIVYANPQDSLELLEKYDYIPLVHSINLYDEIVFIADNNIKSGSLSLLNDSECLSCNGMMVTRIGIKALLEQNIRPKRIFSKDNWMAVVKSVSQGEKPYGFVYKDFYDGLNKLSKSLVTKIAETSQQSIFHSIFIKAELADKSDKLIKLLSEAHLDEKGRDTLKGVNIEKFIPVSRAEILSFKTLLNLESGIME